MPGQGTGRNPFAGESGAVRYDPVSGLPFSRAAGTLTTARKGANLSVRAAVTAGAGRLPAGNDIPGVRSFSGQVHMQYLFDLQFWVRDVLAAHMDRAAAGDRLMLAAILPLGIAFGALHALTPGHSKMVLASYLLGSGKGAAKSLGVAGLLSLTHVGMAVVLALAGMTLVTKTLVGAGRAPSIEAVSRGIIVLIGLWLCVRAVWRTQRFRHEGNGFGVVAGLIPCPLTLFVMIAALRRGIVEIGLMWSVAMAGGIALTLGITALLAVFARDTVLRLAGAYGERAGRISRGVEFAAGLALIVLAARALPA